MDGFGEKLDRLGVPGSGGEWKPSLLDTESLEVGVVRLDDIFDILSLAISAGSRVRHVVLT